MTPDGARAEVYLYGAHIVSWVPAEGIQLVGYKTLTSAMPA